MKKRPTGRVVKCPQCDGYEKFDDKDKMKIFQYKSKKFHLHENCYDEFVYEKEQIDLEQKQKDNLFKFLKKIHGDKMVSNTGVFWTKLDQLRSGENYKSKTKKKNFSYEVIQKAYELALDKIKYAQANKNFNDNMNPNAELFYCLKIIESYLAKAQTKVKRERRKKKIMENQNEEILASKPTERKEEKVEYKRREYENDILDLLE